MSFSQPLATTNPLSVSMDLPNLGISYKWNHLTCGLLYTASFTWHSIFKVHPHCSMYQYFISFYGWIIFHYLNIPHIVYPFISWWTFGGFCFWAILNNDGLEHLYTSFMWTYVLNSLRDVYTHIYLPASIPSYLGVKSLDHVTSPYLTFEELPTVFPQQQCHFTVCQQCISVLFSPHPCPNLLLSF